VVCHICEAPASLECPMCHRGACSRHSERDPGGVRTDVDGRRRFSRSQAVICGACATDWRADTSQIRRAHYCDFCGDNSPAQFTTIECAKCRKHFCSAHGQVICASWFKFPGSESWWFRCIDHKVSNDLGNTVYKGGVFRLMAEEPDPQRNDVASIDHVDWS
jgi:hypothetical protein